MKENREQKPNGFSLATAESVVNDWKKGGGYLDGSRPRRDFLKQVDFSSHSAHSTVENKNQELGTRNSPLAKTLEALGVKNSEKILTEIEQPQ